jgi:hypothetical protein
LPLAIIFRAFGADIFPAYSAPLALTFFQLIPRRGADIFPAYSAPLALTSFQLIQRLGADIFPGLRQAFIPCT